MKSFLKVKTDIKFYATNSSITAECVAITFAVPAGANPVNVNGYPVPAGGSLAIELSAGQIDYSKYEFFFGTGGTGNELYIIRIIPTIDLNNE
jgi:hypothetical protein